MRRPPAPLALLTLWALVGCGASDIKESGPPAMQAAPNQPAPAVMQPPAMVPEMPGAGNGTMEGGPMGMLPLGETMPMPMQPAALDPEQIFTNVQVEVHPRVNTLLNVTWTQTVETQDVWLEFGFEEGNVMKSRPRPGTVGEHTDVVIGVPGLTAVNVRIAAATAAGAPLLSKDYTGTTEAVPSGPNGFPAPTVVSYDPAIASPNRWMFGSVENSDGGCNNQTCFYHTTFWLYIMDRQGRIVWYYADPASNATSSFQRIARDGEYIWIEKRPFGGNADRGVLKMTLDWTYSEYIQVPRLADAIDVTDDGSLLYNVDGQAADLREMTPDGQIRSIWSCRNTFGQNFQCYSNTINWNPIDDTVVMSFPYQNTVVEIDRQTGMLVGQYGEAAGSYTFSPAPWSFEFQHFANITPEGTLMVSSHMPGLDVTENPVAGGHAFEEFTIDRQNRTLVQKWIYNEGQEWAMYKGMAQRVPGGNTLANYGTGGVIREITPDKRTAFLVKFDSTRGNDFFNKMVGHNELIDDLYALNGGGPKPAAQ